MRDSLHSLPKTHPYCQEERAVLCHVTWAETPEVSLKVKLTNHIAGGNSNFRLNQSASSGASAATWRGANLAQPHCFVLSTLYISYFYYKPSNNNQLLRGNSKSRVNHTKLKR